MITFTTLSALKLRCPPLYFSHLCLQCVIFSCRLLPFISLYCPFFLPDNSCSPWHLCWQLCHQPEMFVCVIFYCSPLAILCIIICLYCPSIQMITFATLSALKLCCPLLYFSHLCLQCVIFSCSLLLFISLYWPFFPPDNSCSPWHLCRQLCHQPQMSWT